MSEGCNELELRFNQCSSARPTVRLPAAPLLPITQFRQDDDSRLPFPAVKKTLFGNRDGLPPTKA